jgi:pimeloyl-ACP methyl ester carboxylesterase
VRSSLAKVTVSRLVVYPLRDNIVREGVEEWVRGQDNSRIVYIDNSGHFPLYEQPDVTLAAINQFLDGKWPVDAKTLP